MSDYFLAIILSVIQGLTEFLPISSSAHLLFPTLIFGTNDLGLLFDVATHLGTLLAVITYFRKDLVEIFTAWCPGLKNNEQRFNEGLMLIVGTLPIVIIGLFFMKKSPMMTMGKVPTISIRPSLKRCSLFFNPGHQAVNISTKSFLK